MKAKNCIMSLVLAVLFCCSAACEGQTVNLSGIWDIRPDPDNEGLQAEWFKKPPVDLWQPIVVPASWETALGNEFDTVAWYRKEVRIPKLPAGGRVLLRFHGAATEAHVWVNGKKAGENIGPWTPFTLDITDFTGANELATIMVRLDEKVGHNTQGFLPIVAPHFGGLWQKVELIITKAASIKDTEVRVDAATIGPEKGRATLKAWVPVSGKDLSGLRMRFSLSRATDSTKKPTPGDSVILPVSGETVTWTWTGQAALWSFDKPNLYFLRAELLSPEGRALDSTTKRFGFRHVKAEGPAILVNGKKTVVRGFLSWGYYPPLLAPHPKPELFRERLRYFKRCGFNLVKFCLWLPPQYMLDIVDEEGMLGWIEYPTWHAKFDKAHRAALLSEYKAMALHDGAHPSIILRSITCETGPSADLEVLTEIYHQLKRDCPGTLVEDDSSWISWNRIHDFWDDHSYGNNSWWRGQLKHLDKYRRDRTMKPLLMGEAIAADTWIDTRRFANASVDGKPWWAPNWLDSQLEFERALEKRFMTPKYDVIERLRKTSLKYAMDMRRFQVETYREMLPDAGYVISTVTDVRICNMGLLNQFHEPKWTEEEWGWHHSDTRPLLPGNNRAFRLTSEMYGGLYEEKLLSILAGDTPHLRFKAKQGFWWPTQESIHKPFNGFTSCECWGLPKPVALPASTASFGNKDSQTMQSLFPKIKALTKGKSIPDTVPVVITETLSPEVMDYLERGGRVFHITTNQKGGFRKDGIWFLRGTAWAPPEPAAFFDRVSQDMLTYLQLFDLEGGGVIRGEALWEHVDPLLAFLETHDLDRVRPNLLLFQTNVGKGRLVVSALKHEGGPEKNYAGLWLAHEIVRHLVSGPPPSRSLTSQIRLALKTALTAEIIKVTTPWQFTKDPDNRGVEAGWFKAGFDDKAWQSLMPRSADEGKIWNAYDGWGWYRQTIALPENWAGQTVHIVFDSIDDMYDLYVNGEKAGGYGKLDRSESSFLKRTWVDISKFIRPGKPNQLTLRVHDWVGSGGLNGTVWLTTGPVDQSLDLLRK